MSLNHKQVWQKIDVRFYAALFSIFLSICALARNQPINYDGILYLDAAKAYAQGGITAAFHMFPWPFYSILINGLSHLEHLPLLASAELLNTILIVVMVIAFITLTKELGAARGTQFAAAIIILAYLQFNNIRGFVIRDFGYWAFELIALWQLLRLAQVKSWRHILGWNAAIMIATLFRIEGAILLFFAPLGLLFLRNTPWLTRIALLGKSFFLPIIIAIAIIAWSHKNQGDILGRLPELIDQFTHGWRIILQNYYDQIDVIHRLILNIYSQQLAPEFFFTGSLGTFIWQIIAALNPIYLLLCLHALLKKLMPADTNRQIILTTFIAINLFILLVFYAERFFLDNRYIFAFCLPLLLWAPFSLHKCYRGLVDKTYQGRSRWFALLMCICTGGLLTFSIFHIGISNTYIKQAGLWIKTSTSTTATLYTNNAQVLFYADRTSLNLQMDPHSSETDANVPQNTWHHADVIALRVDPDKVQAVISAAGKPPTQIFENSVGEKVLIFKNN